MRLIAERVARPLFGSSVNLFTFQAPLSRAVRLVLPSLSLDFSLGDSDPWRAWAKMVVQSLGLTGRVR